MPRINETTRIGFDQIRCSPPLTAEQQQTINEMARAEQCLHGATRNINTGSTQELGGGHAMSGHEALNPPPIEWTATNGPSINYHGEDPREMKREGPPDLWSRMDELQAAIETMKRYINYLDQNQQRFEEYLKNLDRRMDPRHMGAAEQLSRMPPTQNSYPPSANEMPPTRNPYAQRPSLEEYHQQFPPFGPEAQR